MAEASRSSNVAGSSIVQRWWATEKWKPLKDTKIENTSTEKAAAGSDSFQSGRQEAVDTDLAGIGTTASETGLA